MKKDINKAVQGLEQKNEIRKSRLRKIGLAILIVMMVILLFRSCEKVESIPEEIKKVVNIGNEETKDGEIEIDREDIQKRLNEEAMKSNLTISMNKVPVFENARVEGNLNIVNDKNNFYDFYVEIFREDTGEMIYQSKIIKKGTYLEKAKLSKILEAGSYKCIAKFNAVHPTEMTLEGSSNAVITITVLN